MCRVRTSKVRVMRSGLLLCSLDVTFLLFVGALSCGLDFPSAHAYFTVFSLRDIASALLSPLLACTLLEAHNATAADLWGSMSTRTSAFGAHFTRYAVWGGLWIIVLGPARRLCT